MKKIVVFFVIVIIVVCGISYLYLNHKANYNIAKKENLQFESYYNKEIYGSDLVTLINKAVDSNEKNNVVKNPKGLYIENNENSIKINILMTDNGKTYLMEDIYNSDTKNFLQYYSNIKFKCTSIEYHNSSNKVKSLIFEQISE